MQGVLAVKLIDPVQDPVDILAESEGVGAGLKERSDVEAEGGVAAFVLAGGLAVDPDGGAVIDGAEIEEDASK